MLVKTVEKLRQLTREETITNANIDKFAKNEINELVEVGKNNGVKIEIVNER